MTGAPAKLRPLGRWSPTLFVVAGVLMLIQVVLIAVRRFGIASFSELWIAPFALAAVLVSLLALMGLYPRLSQRAPRLALAAVMASVLATVLLCTALAWFLHSLSGASGAVNLPTGVLAIIGAFMMTYVLAFAISAVASLKARSYTVAFFLLMPVFMWGAILVIGALGDMKQALQLDVYANVAIAIGFIGLRPTLRQLKDPQLAHT